MKRMKLSGFLLLAAGLPLAAQENWCSDESYHSDGQIVHAEVRDQRLPAAAQNLVDPSQNGSVRVHGWAHGDIQVKACVKAMAQNLADAQALASQVTITDGPGRVVAKGPHPANNQWWSVSYEIWMPSSANLRVQAFNGGISIDNMTSQVRAHTLNGSVKLKNVGGDVEGETTNGSLSIDLAASTLTGKGLKLNTVNGSIQMHLPAAFSADVEASTVHGRVQSDFPNSGDPLDKSNIRFTVGSGGAKVEARTVNGSVRISRQS